MDEERVVIGSKGVIGKAIGEYVNLTTGIDIGTKHKPEKADRTIVHICLPYFDDGSFVDVICKYIKQLKPTLTLIHTTCKIGDTREIKQRTKSRVVHVPVHGTHSNMLEDLKLYRFYVGAVDEEDGLMACDYLDRYCRISNTSYLCATPESTEFSKIMTTEKLRNDILFFQNWKQKHKKCTVNWAEVVDVFEHISERDMSVGRMPFSGRVFQRAGPMDTPISGKHCVSKNKDLIKNGEPA